MHANRPLLLFCLIFTACGRQDDSTTTTADSPALAQPARCGGPFGTVSPNLKNLPVPPLRDGIGNAALKITTKSGEAQAYFDSGLNLLHAFWEFEALRAFQRALELDPDCAMACWGIVMCMPGSQPEFLTERTNAFNRALALRDRVTPREQAYIDALRTLVTQGPAAFAEKMAAQWQNDPTDTDAGALAAYYLKDGYTDDGKRTPSQDRAIQIIEAVLKQSPDHVGALHYAIHLYELGPELDLAVPLAAKITRLAPRAPHLVHMPGHVAFFRGDYDSAIQHFRDGYALDQAYHEKERIDRGENENFAHNTHFLALAYAEAGRLREALLYAEELKRTRIATARLRSEAASVLAYEGRSLAGRLLIRCGEFQRAIDALKLESAELSPSAPRYFLDGLGAAARGLLATRQNRRGDIGLALTDLTRWHDLLQESRARISGSEEKFYAQRASTVLDILIRVLRAHAASSPESARIFLQSAIEAERAAGGSRLDPPLLPLSIHELAGAFHLAAEDAKAALSAYTTALGERPLNGHVLVGIARAEKLAQNLPAAQIALDKARAAFQNADSSLPAATEARATIQAR